MAQRVYNNLVGTQNHDAAAFYRGFSAITTLEYPGEGEEFIGETLYGADDLGTDGLHHEKHFHTRLQGQAALMPDKVRQRFPQAFHRTGSILVHGYQQLGISHEYYPEDLEDNLPGFEWLANMAADLPVLLKDAEEDLLHRFYNEGELVTSPTGESRLVGFAQTPLFVNGDSAVLQLLGNPSYFSGTAASNIIEIGGGVSYAMLELIRQYGRNFVNEEGRTQKVRPVRIVGREQNIELLRMYINHPSNIENFDPNRPNPVSGWAGSIELVSTERMDQPNDFWVFYEGWQDNIKMRAKYQNKGDSWEEGHAQYRKAYAQVRSRLGFYAYTNRQVVLVRGAA